MSPPYVDCLLVQSQAIGGFLAQQLRRTSRCCHMTFSGYEHPFSHLPRNQQLNSHVSVSYLPHLPVLKIPGGQRVQVFVGTAFILGVSAIPVLYKPQKRGHDLFSQEKPQAVEERQEELKQQYRQARKQKQQEND